ncbi:hypothetical protein Tco_1468555 [Tanacetum coccineum]
MTTFRELLLCRSHNAILGVYTTLDEHSDLACKYLGILEKCKRLENELSKRTEHVNNKSFNELSKRFSELEQHSINLELALQQSQEQIKLDKVWKQKESSSFRELNDKFFEIQDLKTYQGKKQEVEDHLTYGKCVLNDNHDLCVLHYINGVNSRTKKPIVVPISTREPKRTVNQSVATPHKKTVASESTIKKPRSTYRKLYQHFSKTCSWWYLKLTPPGYKWEPKSESGNVNTNVSMPLRIESRTFNISEPKTVRVSTLSNTLLSSNSLQLVEIILFIVDSGCSKHMTGNLKFLVNFMEKFLGKVKFRNDQFAPILGYGDLVQGNVTIKRVYYVEGLNRSLFSVGQLCDVDLEVAFRKSTCYIRDLKGNDLLRISCKISYSSFKIQLFPIQFA